MGNIHVAAMIHSPNALRSGSLTGVTQNTAAPSASAEAAKINCHNSRWSPGESVAINGSTNCAIVAPIETFELANVQRSQTSAEVDPRNERIWFQPNTPIVSAEIVKIPAAAENTTRQRRVLTEYSNMISGNTFSAPARATLPPATG